MSQPQELSIQDFTYLLPEERIAAFPLEERDASKLLVYRAGSITTDIYKNIDTHLPSGSLLVFNDTRVINARILFQKLTGGVIEIFCLEPVEAVNEYSTMMNQRAQSVWKCMIGGASKWKGGPLEKPLLVQDKEVLLRVELLDKLPDAYVARFSWTPDHYSFAEVLLAAGDVPLPPYIKRKTDSADAERYQTIYARAEGSVAAPTAGLHFTPAVMDKLGQKAVGKTFVTLHVGAGTFKPVKAAVMADHEMHAEWIDVAGEDIQHIHNKLEQGITAVGTTSLRTLESLYWLGVKAALQPDADSLQLQQWDVYQPPLSTARLHAGEALTALLNWLHRKGMTRLFTQTQLLIAPGYRFRMVQAIVTNFHQPQSTLLLLVAAAVGEQWRSIYEYALQNDFRFLSYGDGSLLFIDSI